MFGLNAGLNVGFNECLSTQLVAPNTFNGIYNPFRVVDTARITCNEPIINHTVTDKINLIGTSNYLKINNV